MAIAGNETLIGLDLMGRLGVPIQIRVPHWLLLTGCRGMFGLGFSARNSALKPGLVIFHVKMLVLDGTRRPADRGAADHRW